MERLPRYSVKWKKQGQKSVIQHASFCVNREENDNIYAQRNFERMAKKLISGEGSMQPAEGGWETFYSFFKITLDSCNVTALLN